MSNIEQHTADLIIGELLHGLNVIDSPTFTAKFLIFIVQINLQSKKQLNFAKRLLTVCYWCRVIGYIENGCRLCPL